MTAARRLRVLMAIFIAFIWVVPASLPAHADASGTVHLQTVPAVPGVELAVGPDVVTTGSDGSASVAVANLNGVANSVTLADPHVTPGMDVRLTRVAILPHVTPHTSNLQVGLAVTSIVQLALDPGLTGVPISSILSIRLHSATGEVRTIDPRGSPSVPLLARQARLIHNTLTAQIVSWSVDSVTAAPGVAVRSTEPRFDPLGVRIWSLHLGHVAGTVRIHTVPATAGVTFLLEGTVATTGKDGTATTAVPDLSDVYSRVTLANDSAGALRVTLLNATRAAPTAPHEREIVAGLAVDRPVQLRFVDRNDNQVQVERISAVRLQADGRTLRRGGADLRAPILLRSAEATLVRNTWRVHRLTYAMETATIDGGEAAFAGQQHFQPAAAANWQVQLAIFAVTVTAHDALFGGRVASDVVVTRPDGTQYVRELASGGAPAKLESVVRGDYHFRLTTAILGATTSVHISRNDNVDVRVVTALDAVAVGIVIALMASAAIYGAVRVTRQEAGEE